VDCISGGQQKYLDGSVCLAQTRKNLPAIEAGQHYIQNDEVEVHILRQLQPVQTIARHIDNKACFSQAFFQKLCGLRFIVYDQNSHMRPGPLDSIGVQCRQDM
jgi:hypothetical protein